MRTGKGFFDTIVSILFSKFLFSKGSTKKNNKVSDVKKEEEEQKVTSKYCHCLLHWIHGRERTVTLAASITCFF